MNNILKEYFDTISSSNRLSHAFLICNSDYDNLKEDLSRILSDYFFHLEIDIEKEKDAIQNYLLHCDAIKDEGIKKLLLRIIEDEIIHLEYFEKQLSVINKNMD